MLELRLPLAASAELEIHPATSYPAGMHHECVAAMMKRITAERRFDEVHGFTQTFGRWLDVGCGDGRFVQVVGEQGIDASGVELSAEAVCLAKKNGLNVTCGTVYSLPEKNSFDTITAFDVLGHVFDPAEFLSEIFKRLHPNGTLVLTLPDTNSLSRRLMGRRWYFYNSEESLHYFSRDNLGSLLEATGFKVNITRRTYKLFSWEFWLTQSAEFDPIVHRILSRTEVVLPSSMRQKVIPLPIGEMMLVAGRR